MKLAALTGAVLLGGASKRMGRDKAHLQLAGVALARRTAELLHSFCFEVLLVGGAPAADWPGRAVADPPGPRCALRGLIGALQNASAPRVLVCATDLPALGAPLLLGLAALPEADAVLPRRHQPEPLCAIYRRETVLPVARARFARGELSLRGLLQELQCTWLEGADLAALGGCAALANANTPAQWRAFARAAEPRP